MRISAYEWTINGYQWILVDISGYQWILVDISGYQWILMNMNQYQWVLMGYEWDIDDDMAGHITN